LSDPALEYKGLRKEFLQVSNYLNETITLEKGNSETVLLKFEDSKQNPAPLMKVMIKLNESSFSEHTTDVFGNIILSNISANQKIQISTNDDRF